MTLSHLSIPLLSDLKEEIFSQAYWHKKKKKKNYYLKVRKGKITKIQKQK